jgi:hypothetical protein
MDPNVFELLELLRQHFNQNTLGRLLLGKAGSTPDDLKKIHIRPVDIKGLRQLSFVYEYPTRHITRNFSLDEGLNQLAPLLVEVFRHAVLFTTDSEIELLCNRKKETRLMRHKVACPLPISTDHDHAKVRLVPIADSPYLIELGVVSQNGDLIKPMHSKYRQIEKYVETLDAVIKKSALAEKQEIRVLDMGSGKGYLTFALYDHLTRHLGKQAAMVGVELREELVSFCCTAADRCGFTGLSFQAGEIGGFETGPCDMLIALHACDTATDDAIYQGIKANAEIIITAPCCHKQIRRELEVKNALSPIIRHGILAERQAEIVTDTLRGLILEACGYATQIFEFIADAHTHKNVMICGVKKKKPTKRKQYLTEISELKALFGIKTFYLENLLDSELSS